MASPLNGITTPFAWRGDLGVHTAATDMRSSNNTKGCMISAFLDCESKLSTNEMFGLNLVILEKVTLIFREVWIPLLVKSNSLCSMQMPSWNRSQLEMKFFSNCHQLGALLYLIRSNLGHQHFNYSPIIVQTF
jgi:hypothetical protein